MAEWLVYLESLDLAVAVPVAVVSVVLTFSIRRTSCMA